MPRTKKERNACGRNGPDPPPDTGMRTFFTRMNLFYLITGRIDMPVKKYKNKLPKPHKKCIVPGPEKKIEGRLLQQVYHNHVKKYRDSLKISGKIERHGPNLFDRYGKWKTSAWQNDGKSDDFEGKKV